CPLRAARILQRNNFQAGAIQQLREFLNARIRSIGRLKRTDPGVAADVEADVAGLDNVTGGESGTANDVAYLCRQNFFVADAVLNRADRAGIPEQMSSLLDGWPGVGALGGHDSEFTGWDLF